MNYKNNKISLTINKKRLQKNQVKLWNLKKI